MLSMLSWRMDFIYFVCYNEVVWQRTMSKTRMYERLDERKWY